MAGVRMLARFLRDRRGNVAILSTVMLTSLVGVSGLVAEFGDGLLNRMQDQRIADVAAMGGGTVYNSTSSTTAMQTAVNNIATLNGLSTSQISASLVNSPSGDGNQAVEVTVQSTVPLVLSRVLWNKSSLSVNATSYAELKAGAPGCIMALSTSGSGVSLSGGTSITADQCAITSNTSVTCANHGIDITTKQVMYDTTLDTTNCTFQPPTGGTITESKGLSTDPLAGTTEVTTATSRLGSVEALTSPSGPNVTGGTAVAFGYRQSTTQSELTADGCSGTFASNTWTVTCTGASTFTFGAISLSGGITVNFNTGGSASNTYNFNGEICDSGTALHFGPGTYNISGGVASGGGSITTFGAGTFNIGDISGSSCQSGSNGYSIYNTGSVMTFGNSTTPSTFVLAGGIDNKGGETLVLGASCTNGGSACTSTSGSNTFTSAIGNSFNIGKTGSGDSLDMGGGAQTYFGDASGSSDLFQMAGNLNVSSGGGSCLWIGAASEHDINGFFATAGGNTLGAGIYTVSAYVALGGNGGGDVTCGGSDVGMYANGVTFVVGGTSTNSSSCAGVTGTAFCVAAGYSNVTLVAPSSGNTQGLAVIGPTSSSNTAQVSFGEGASNTSVSGAFYFPYGAISLSGAATLGDGTGQCLMLIGSQVTLSGGSTVASNCNIPGQNGSGTSGLVALVQ